MQAPGFRLARREQPGLLRRAGRQAPAVGPGGRLRHVESPDHASKVQFLQSLDVLSVPTVYREPKGLYVLESLANGVPVVQPRHGSFPELIDATGGGLLVNPEDPADLAQGLRRLLEDENLRRDLGEKGRQAVRERFHADKMAERTLEVYGGYLSRREAAHEQTA